MTGPEATIERQVCREAREQGWIVRKLAFLGTGGAPDRVFGKGGRGVFIEFKQEGGVPSPQQLRRHAELRVEFGFEVHACDGVALGRHILGLEE